MYDTFIFLINLLSLNLVLGSTLVALLVSTKWNSFIMRRGTLFFSGLSLYLLSSIYQDSLFQPNVLIPSQITTIFFILGHTLFVFSSPLLIANLISHKSITKREWWFISILYTLFLLTLIPSLESINIGVIIVTITSIVIRMLILLKGTINNLSENRLVRLYRLCLWGTALFIPFIVADIYRFFTLCQTHPALSLYVIFLTILLIRISYVHFTLFESSTAQEKLTLQLSQFGFSERELEIAHSILQGLSNKVIADKASISVKTVETHCRNIYKKANVTSRPSFFAKIFLK